MMDIIATLYRLIFNPNIIFSFLMVGAVYWTVVMTLFITLRLHSRNNGRVFKDDFQTIATEPQALAHYYGLRLVGYALIAAACILAAP